MDSRLPTEVELAYEVMPCQAMRVAAEPAGKTHPCTYFRRWGTYHAYDYTIEGAPPTPGLEHKARYVGRAPMVPELLSGCRKAPILAVGINPNLPGWWPERRRSLSPLFDDYRQYAHYFRYRAVFKVQLSAEDYHAFGGGDHDTPFTDFELAVPPNADGEAEITLHRQDQSMYRGYQGLLDGLAERMGWTGAKLAVGEDLSYGNMVASPSARWTLRADPDDPLLPPMTTAERDGIVDECFRERRYFLRQLFQSLPPILLVFSQNTAQRFVEALQERFVQGDPLPSESLEELMSREVRLGYGEADGKVLDARVIFSPHITGNSAAFAAAREHVLGELVEEVGRGALALNPATGRLTRGPGACVFCPMLEIGPCEYLEDLRPLSTPPVLTADSPVGDLNREKALQDQLLGDLGRNVTTEAWGSQDEDVDRERP